MGAPGRVAFSHPLAVDTAGAGGPPGLHRVTSLSQQQQPSSPSHYSFEQGDDDDEYDSDPTAHAHHDDEEDLSEEQRDVMRDAPFMHAHHSGNASGSSSHTHHQGAGQQQY